MWIGSGIWRGERAAYCRSDAGFLYSVGVGIYVVPLVR